MTARSIVLTGALVGSAAATLQLEVEPDPENVVASRLEGVWVPDPAISQRLGTESHEIELRFEVDASVAAAVPAQYRGFFQDRRP